MRLALLGSILLALALTGCASFTVEARKGGTVEVADARKPPHPRPHLGIPPGHLPRPGYCRVWHPGTPPGHQPRPGRCSVVKRDLRAGDWLVYRPSEERHVVRVSVYHERRPDVRMAVRIYDYETGRFLREE